MTTLFYTICHFVVACDYLRDRGILGMPTCVKGQHEERAFSTEPVSVIRTFTAIPKLTLTPTSSTVFPRILRRNPSPHFELDISVIYCEHKQTFLRCLLFQSVVAKNCKHLGSFLTARYNFHHS